MPFTVTTSGKDKLGLRQTPENIANEQWPPDYLGDEQRVAWIMDQFKRTMASELKLLSWKCGKNGPQKNFQKNCCLAKNMLEVGCGVG